MRSHSGDVHRHRLLAEDVLARLCRRDSVHRVQVHRRRRVDGVGLRSWTRSCQRACHRSAPKAVAASGAAKSARDLLTATSALPGASRNAAATRLRTMSPAPMRPHFTASCSGGSRALRIDVDGVERLAGSHEEAVALRPAETDIAAHLRQPDAPDQLPVGIPDSDAVVADGTAGVAGTPDVAIHVAADAVGRALHAVDHEIGEPLDVRQRALADVEDVHVAFPARPLIAGPAPVLAT